MKLKNSFFYTLREDIKDEESTSGKLLVKSGMVKKNSNGVYILMPLGKRVVEKITDVVREEMNNTGAQEVKMPSLIPEEVYVASGRRDNFGKDMFNLKDRYERNYVLGPTHEELFLEAAKMQIKSYKDMPFNLYQIASKYRDEPRPRYGLIRVREFTMKDAYSFDIDEVNLNRSYKKQFDAYCRIFDRIGIDYKIVKADTGTMGGSLSEEFQALSDIGEDTLVICENCDYASNIEVCEPMIRSQKTNPKKPKKLIDTGTLGKINELSEGLNIPKESIIKTLIYKANKKYYACLITGDREINELKLSKVLKTADFELASKEEVKEITGSELGYAGPIGLKIPIIIDSEVLMRSNFLIGANQTGKHYINANMTDFKYDIKESITTVIDGDKCPKCTHELVFKKGIEIGNTFKLGTKYSSSLGLKYLDENNQEQNVVMGCYGIGIERLMAAFVEQNNDQYGIKWNNIIAPYQVAIVVIDPTDELQITEANKIYDQLNELGIDVIMDDRDKRPGIKFNDMDLIGIPYRITIGKKINEELVEFKLRSESTSEDIHKDDVIDKIKEYLS